MIKLRKIFVYSSSYIFKKKEIQQLSQPSQALSILYISKIPGKNLIKETSLKIFHPSSSPLPSNTSQDCIWRATFSGVGCYNALEAIWTTRRHRFKVTMAVKTCAAFSFAGWYQKTCRLGRLKVPILETCSANIIGRRGWPATCTASFQWPWHQLTYKTRIAASWFLGLWQMGSMGFSSASMMAMAEPPALSSSLIISSITWRVSSFSQFLLDKLEGGNVVNLILF